LHWKLSDKSADIDSTSLSATETSVMCVENIVITSGTVEASSNFPGAASPECTVETAEEALVTSPPPQKPTGGGED